MKPQFRNTVERMDRHTFFYNFNNRPILSRRNTVWLCYEVKTRGPSMPTWGAKIFRGQVYFEPQYHAEMCFLSWFCGNQLPAYKRFRITWFVSWTPCPDCVAKVAEFLAEHPNVTLTISAARLYYYWETDYRRALCRLRQAGGARVKIMDNEEFAYCWEKFVYNEGQSFMPWDKFDDNYAFLHSKLKEILRNPMEAMYPHIFYFHFKNLRKAYGRNESWLCFTMEIIKHCSTVSWKKGVFRNQVESKTHCHAEKCFLSWFCEDILSPNTNYQVTWYTSWSPCLDCAGEVAEFLARHSNVKLTIYTARLYYFWDTDYQEGLRSLSEEGASVEIMIYEDFKYCWENFVYNGDERFKPWKGLKDNFLFLDSKLQEILE
ncbi:DNA dC-_dU-editing enzyme APOBEC-3F isoform X2 [Trachypithecus francoisi]|uniref:DNA dC->dU-editing enzyme APOBEC-3F isoform X2 n=1 Tax=Trachypithecus francoisi TaxID=54180 RepID=UPI00141A691D|nr:DNA dC->dU-editing enzyme APOBEC-3F isoform X2 [Trachypithecus francoisi]